MNYVPGFDDLLRTFGVYTISAGILYMVRYVDEEIRESDTTCLWKYWGTFSTLTVLALFFSCKTFSGGGQICLLLMAVYLVVCSVMDMLLCRVNDFMQYLGALGGCYWVCLQRPEAGVGIALILFAVLQYTLFMRMYGKADGMAFSICALFLAGIGMDLEGYLYHMAICFLLLAVVQGVKRNISLKGRLKEAVALYPYITVSFWLVFPVLAEAGTKVFKNILRI